jgi:hypothetical protein
MASGFFMGHVGEMNRMGALSMEWAASMGAREGPICSLQRILTKLMRSGRQKEVRPAH